MFFDNASTTRIDDEIIDRLSDFNNEYFYNPGALYADGLKTKYKLDEFKKTMLECLQSDNGKIVFTGSATEANNMALFGTLRKNTRKILISMGEHPSVYNSALEIKNRGFDVEFVKLDRSGKVDIDDFKSKMTSDVDFVSIMNVSNETGAINDIASLVSIAKDVNPNVIFHSDGVQAFGKIEVNIDEIGVDLYTISAHKIHGSKGVGALYVKNGVALKPIIFGGGQEENLRSGTENMLGIYTLVEASKISTNNLKKNFEYVSSLKNYFLSKISESNLNYNLHSFEENSPYIVSISFLGCRAETLLNKLSDFGICVGNGSACSSKKKSNRVLENMGLTSKDVESNLRISFSKFNTFEEIDFLCEKLIYCVNDYLDKTK